MSEQGVLRFSLPPGWRPLRGWVLLVVVVAVLNVVGYVGLTRPRWFDVTAQSRALEAAQEARQLLEPALAEARVNYGSVLQAEIDLEELHRRIAASAKSISSVSDNLEDMLRAVGMRVDRVTYATERIDELDLLLLQIAVPLAGRYSAVRELVESLAAGDGFMAIDQVGLASPDQSGAGGSLQVELQLAAFLPASDEDANGQPTPPPGNGATSVTAPRRTRPSAEVSPVRRAGELQEQLASLPPLPYPPDAYDVRLDDLDVSTEVSESPGRNLFDYVRPPAPVAPPAQPRPRPQQPAGGAGPGGQGARRQQEAASHPSLPLRLLGIVRVGTVRYATLTDGTEMHVVAEGVSLPGGYQIIEVGIDFAEIKWGEQQVRLTLES